MSKRKFVSLSKNNRKIIKFFNEHESLDFDETILSFINIILIKKFLNNFTILKFIH